MASFSKGTSFTDGVTGDVTAAKLHALVDAATPVGGLVTDRTAKTSVIGTDVVLISDSADSNNLKKVTVTNLANNLPTAVITNGTVTTLNSTTGTITTGVIPTLTSTTLITSGTGTAAAPAITRDSDTDTGIFFPAADTIAFSEGGTEAMRIDSSGNVGIKNTAPSTTCSAVGGYGLVIGDGTGSPSLALYGANNTGQGVYFGDSSTGTASYAGFIDYLHQSNALRLGTDATERLRIDSSGNVGIGTSTSLVRLTVDSGSAVQYGKFNSTAANGGYLTFESSGTVHGDIGTAAQVITSGSASDFGINARGSRNMVFGTNNTERLRITSGGDVCVGATSSRAGRFTVEGGSSVATVASLFSNATGDVGQRVLLISKTDDNTTTSQVFVTFAVNNANTNSGQINANGANQAAFGSSSDERLKQNIQNIPSQWDNFKSLRPVEFDYIESEGGGHQIGFIAQEVLEIFPDIVGEKQDGMLTLSGLGKNEARLIKALQEAMERIEQLESKVAALEAA